MTVRKSVRWSYFLIAIAPEHFRAEVIFDDPPKKFDNIFLNSIFLTTSLFECVLIIKLELLKLNSDLPLLFYCLNLNVFAFHREAFVSVQ